MYFKLFYILMQNVVISDCGDAGENAIEMFCLLRKEQEESMTPTVA